MPELVLQGLEVVVHLFSPLEGLLPFLAVHLTGELGVFWQEGAVVTCKTQEA